MKNIQEIARALFCGNDAERKEAREVIASMSDDDRKKLQAFIEDALDDGDGSPDEETQRDALLATRPDLTRGQRSYLATESIATLRALLSLLPRESTAAASIRSSVGSNGAVRASRLPRAEHAEVAARFGRQVEKASIHWQGSSLVFPQISRSDAAALLEKRAKEGPLPRSAEMDEVRARIMPAFRAMRGAPTRE